MSSSFVGDASTGNPPDVPFFENEIWLDRPDHPLMNDLILKLLFGKVRRYDLKACRGVCKKWNEHAIPHMRSTFQATIYGTKSEDENSETHQIVDFVKLFKSNELGIPFEKYRLGAFRTTDGDGKQFLDICGQFIKEIVLHQPHYVAPFAGMIEDISELLKLSPTLESLTISGRFVSGSRNPVKLFPDSTSTPVLSALKNLTFKITFSEFSVKQCPTFFDELLSVASNISHIAIEDVNHPDNSKCAITYVLNSIEKLGMESSIQSLSLKSASFKHFKILRSMAEKPNGLKLKEFSFTPNSYFTVNTNSTDDIQFQLATIFKDTLEDFNMANGYRTIYLMEFPNMPKLKSFKFGVRKDLAHKHVDLNHIFPVLETLNIRFEYAWHHGGNGSQFFSQFYICPTLKTFIMENNVTSPRTFRNILSVFPNLTKLTLSLAGLAGQGAKQVLQRIFTRMPQLESLCLLAYIGSTLSIELDSLVTGIPIHGLNTIRRVIPDFEKMTVEGRRKKISNLVERHGTPGPSIRNLTNLRHLKLDLSGGWKSNFNLSDFTGYLAIYLMDRLTHLDIEHCYFKKTCCEILTKETGLESWSFQTGDDGRMGRQHIIPPFGIPDRESKFRNPKQFTKTCCEILTMETGVEEWSFQTGDWRTMESKHIIPPFQIPDTD